MDNPKIGKRRMRLLREFLTDGMSPQRAHEIMGLPIEFCEAAAATLRAGAAANPEGE